MWSARAWFSITFLLLLSLLLSLLLLSLLLLLFSAYIAWMRLLSSRIFCVNILLFTLLIQINLYSERVCVFIMTCNAVTLKCTPNNQPLITMAMVMVANGVRWSIALVLFQRYDYSSEHFIPRIYRNNELGIFPKRLMRMSNVRLWFP